MQRKYGLRQENAASKSSIARCWVLRDRKRTSRTNDTSVSIGLGPNKLEAFGSQSLDWYRPYFENYIVDASILKKIKIYRIYSVDHLVFSSL